MKKIILLSFVICLFGTSLDGATVAYYKFNGTGTAPVGTAINDLAGNNHGQVAGANLTYGMDSLMGGYLTFKEDGLDRIVIPGSSELVFATYEAYTFEILFRTTQTGTTLGALLSKGCDVSNPDSQYWIRHQGNGTVRGLIEGLDNTAEDNATSSTAVLVNDGSWHHVALVYDGTGSTKRLQIYIDGALLGSDNAIGTSGIVGGDDNDPLIIGEFATLGLNRSFAGDIAAVRFSRAALTPPEFLQVAATFISDVAPADGTSFLPPGTVAGFRVKSPTIGVASSAIKVALNGQDISSQLTITGGSADWAVTLPALTANRIYQVSVEVTDTAGNKVSESFSFNTFSTGIVFVEGEDYNFNGGQFIDNPQLSSVPGPANYLDQLGVEGIDYHQTNAVVNSLYRIGDRVGTIFSQDTLRQAYIDAKAIDPGVDDYVVNDNGNTEWLNYTRTFPANTYRVYARVGKSGSAPIILGLDEVTSGSSSSTQTLSPLGLIKAQPTGAAQTYAFAPLVDALGNEMAVRLSGVKTLRLTMLSGTLGLNLNYLVFVPLGEQQPPFLTAVNPASGADNELPNVTIQAAIRNADTTVNTGSVIVQLDGSTVPAVVTLTSTGSTVSYPAASLSLGLHTVAVIYRDSAEKWTTNQWQFRVANQAIRGYWKFDEKVPGNAASTAPGAILDASGNERNGTSSSVPGLYVEGSTYYGGTSALRLNGGLDRIVVPDPMGTFNFTNSFTMEAVIRTTNQVAGGALLAKNGTDGEGEYWWRMPGSGARAQQVAMNGRFIAGTNTINDGEWHHVAVVYDAIAGEIRLYADYRFENMSTSGTFPSPIGRPSDLTIGSFFGGGSEFIGDIDFIRISSGALAPAEFVQPTVLTEPVVQALRPANNAHTVSPNARVEAEIANREASVVGSSLKLFLDGNNVTAASTISADAAGAKISYAPASSLANGPHTATLIFTDSMDRSFTNAWSFSVNSTVTTLGHYRFDEKQQGQSADIAPGSIIDSSGNSRNGTVAAPDMPYVPGSPAYGETSALQFTVTASNFVAVPDPAGVFNFGPTQSVTFEAIIKTTTIGEASVGALLAKQLASASEWYWRIESSGKQRLAINDGSSLKTLTGNFELNDGEWHHIAAVYDGSTKQIRLYVDYLQDGVLGVSFGAHDAVIGNAQDLYIGIFQNGTRRFEGEIDAIRISAAALDPSWFMQTGVAVDSVVLGNVTTTGGNIGFSFTTQSGRSYTVQSSGSLGGSWSPVETFTGTGALKSVSYPATGGQRFYRVRMD
jgi:hypothetical protein